MVIHTPQLCLKFQKVILPMLEDEFMGLGAMRDVKIIDVMTKRENKWMKL